MRVDCQPHSFFPSGQVRGEGGNFKENIKIGLPGLPNCERVLILLMLSPCARLSTVRALAVESFHVSGNWESLGITSIYKNVLTSDR